MKKGSREMTETWRGKERTRRDKKGTKCDKKR